MSVILNGTPPPGSRASSGSTGSRGHAENIRKVAVTMPRQQALFFELDQILYVFTLHHMLSVCNNQDLIDKLMTMASDGEEIVNPTEESFVVDEPTYLCSTCGKSFSRKYSFQRHIRVHDNTRIFPCQDCDSSYNCKYDLDNHSRRKHGAAKLICQTCSKEFSHQQSLLAHARRCNAEEKGVLQCTDCIFKTNRKSELQVHYNAKHQKQHLFECKACGKKFKWRSSLSYHRKQHGE